MSLEVRAAPPYVCPAPFDPIFLLSQTSSLHLNVYSARFLSSIYFQLSYSRFPLHKKLRALESCNPPTLACCYCSWVLIPKGTPYSPQVQRAWALESDSYDHEQVTLLP